jgi:phage recombination protein Bet
MAQQSSAVALREETGLAEVRRFAPPAVQVEQWDEERRAFVRKNFCGGAPDHIADLAMALWERRGLSPEERHVYLVQRGGDWVNQTGIDGYRLIATRSGVYVGSDEPAYDTEEAEHPNKATVTVWRLVEGQRFPFSASARWSEYAGKNKDGSLNRQWKQMPYLMLAKCAEALALRKAFPAELSGIYVKEEMDQAEAITVTAREVPNRTVDPQTGEISDALTERTATAIKNQAKALNLSEAEVNDLAVAAFNVPDAGVLQELDGLRLAKLLTYARHIHGAMVTSRMDKIGSDIGADPDAEFLLDSQWLSDRFEAKKAELEAKVAQGQAGGR